jgi:hypothetical protein
MNVKEGQSQSHLHDNNMNWLHKALSRPHLGRFGSQCFHFLLLLFSVFSGRCDNALDVSTPCCKQLRHSVRHVAEHAHHEQAPSIAHAASFGSAHEPCFYDDRDVWCGACNA